MAATHLLVSDLDNTLLGDDDGLDRFADWVLETFDSSEDYDVSTL